MKYANWVGLETNKYDLLTIVYLPEKRSKYHKFIDRHLLSLASTTIIRRLFPDLTKRQIRKLKKILTDESDLINQWKERKEWLEFEKWKSEKNKKTKKIFT